jgi:tetratricopeptide (TPR) repeat protein
MPAENYKKWTIAAVGILIAAIVIFAVTTSDHKEKKLPSGGGQTNALPSGPLMDSNMQTPGGQMENLLDNPEKLALLGDQYFETGRYDKAVQAYEKVLRLKPDDADTYNDMGLALYYLGRPAPALEILKKGTQVAPSYQRMWLSLGFVLMSSGKNEEAKKSLTKAAQLDPRTDVGQEAKKLLERIK